MHLVCNICCCKGSMVRHFDSDIESFDKERTDILQRRNYLIKKNSNRTTNID